MTSGFQFDQLLSMYKTQGLNVLELQVRVRIILWFVKNHMYHIR